jgi:hypothetical protein
MMAQRETPPATEREAESDGVRWLALLLRQAALLLVAGIELRYGLRRRRE